MRGVEPKGRVVPRERKHGRVKEAAIEVAILVVEVVGVVGVVGVVVEVKEIF